MIASFLLAVTCLLSTTNGCSRVSYNSGAADGERIIVGRTMDWLEPINSSMWAFPAGMQRTGEAGPNSLTWTSKYGSVITTGYDLATVDGINTEGLVGNVLYLADGDYGERDPSRPGLSIGLYQQYFIDNYATVAEAVADLYTSSGVEKFQVVTAEIVPGVYSLGHISLGDKFGDNAIFEHIDGKLVVYHSKNYTVMTNEPSYDQQLAIDNYWAPVANVTLPGTDRPADRFARLSYYSRTVPNSTDYVSALAATAGMIRAVSVPLKFTSKANPNISPTLWYTYADTSELLYLFESALSPMAFYVNLNEMDLSASGQVKTLTLNNTWTERLGDMSQDFKQAAPFTPLVVA
ncbi:hypothetical protein P7C71_g5450, partial [Lecanoromycetidae sp. Uapishka_2]